MDLLIWRKLIMAMNNEYKARSLIYTWDKNVASVSIGNGVTGIGDSAFYRCSGLTSVTIGAGVTNIGEWAFEGCNLTSVTIPNSVMNISRWAFSMSIINNVTFEGRNKSTVQGMSGYPFGFDGVNFYGTVTIHCTDGDIQIQASGE